MSGLLGVLLASGGGFVVSLSGETVSDIQSSPATATATITIKSTGIVEKTENVTTTQIDSPDWVSPTSLAGGAFEVQATVNSGAVSAGTTGSWLALSSDRSWTCTSSIVGTATANLTLAIRHNGGATLASNTYVLEAQVIP